MYLDILFSDVTGYLYIVNLEVRCASPICKQIYRMEGVRK